MITMISGWSFALASLNLTMKTGKNLITSTEEITIVPLSFRLSRAICDRLRKKGIGMLIVESLPNT